MKLNIEEYEKIINECKIIAIKKNNDYGCDVLFQFGLRGLLVRIGDKFHRLKSLIWDKKIPKVDDESIEDTLKDLINYSLYIIMMNREKLAK